MSLPRRPYQRDFTRSDPSLERHEEMENIELGPLPPDPEINVHPAFRHTQDSSWQPARVHGPTLISDPDSYNPRSSGGDSSWSQRRLLNWLKGQQRPETSASASAPFSGTRELGADEYHLAITGYDQVFKRYFTQWDTLFAMLATMGLSTSMPAILFLVIVYAGGPGAGLMNWIVIGLFSVVLTLCLGEIAASMPTSAGKHTIRFLARGIKLTVSSQGYTSIASGSEVKTEGHFWHGSQVSVDA